VIENVAAQLCLKTDSYDDRIITYLDVQLVHAPERSDIGDGKWVGKWKELKLRDKTGYLLLKIPIEQLRDNQEAPFYGMEEDDLVMVELPPSQDGFRVYKWEDYHYRHREVDLVLRTPLLVPLVRDTGEVDLAWDRDEPGQRVRFVPYDRSQFIDDLEEVAANDPSIETPIRGIPDVDRDLFHQVVNKHGLSIAPVESVKLYHAAADEINKHGLISRDRWPWRLVSRTKTDGAFTARLPALGGYKVRWGRATRVGDQPIETPLLHRDAADQLQEREDYKKRQLHLWHAASPIGEEWWTTFAAWDEDTLVVYCHVST
jgi:hypothetical protein